MSFPHLDRLRGEVAELARRFDDAGYRLYLVGGIVRDQWLGHPLDDSADIDLTTDAVPATVRALVGDVADAMWTQGERFGTIGLRFRGRAIEITTHRAETYADTSRKPEVSFGTDLTVDLSRRDFTVNAMAIDVVTAELVDPWHGARDLAAAVLRTPLEPEVSFGDDPLRMLRAARFAARFSLEPDPHLLAAATTMRERLRIVAIERIGDELRRLFALADPGRGVAFLRDTGLLHELLTWKQPDMVIDDGALDAAVTCVARVVERGKNDWRLRLAALLAALRPAAQPDRPDALAAAITRRLRLSSDERQAITGLVRAAHGVLATIDNPIDSASMRRWRAEASADFDDSIDLAHALVADDRDRARDIDDFAARLATLQRDEPADLLRPLDGAQVMQLLGIAAGPAVGEAIVVLRQALLDEGPLPAAAQNEILRTWWSDRPTST